MNSNPKRRFWPIAEWTQKVKRYVSIGFVLSFAGLLYNHLSLQATNEQMKLSAQQIQSDKRNSDKKLVDQYKEALRTCDDLGQNWFKILFTIRDNRMLPSEDELFIALDADTKVFNSIKNMNEIIDDNSTIAAWERAAMLYWRERERIVIHRQMEAALNRPVISADALDTGGIIGMIKVLDTAKMSMMTYCNTRLQQLSISQ